MLVTGYGGFTIQHGFHIAHGVWSAEEMTQSSTWRELVAVRRVLESLVSKLKNQQIKWFPDNQNVVRILEVGSKKHPLQKEALEVFSIASRKAIQIEPEWNAHTDNQQADYLSRIQDRDDWSVSPECFAYIDSIWGPQEVDWFADNFIIQKDTFNSRFWCPGTSAVDTFTCDWSHEINWACPPPYLILHCIRHASVTAARGTLVVPAWPSALFWPILFAGGEAVAKFIRDTIVFPGSGQMLLPGRQGSVLPVCDLLGIQFDFGMKEA